MTTRVKPDCWTCEHRKEVPGSAHSACAHPSIGERPPLEKVMAIFASPYTRRTRRHIVGRAPPIVGTTPELNIVGDPHGIARGWFNWPHNFDPLWLENCDGYSKREEA